LNGKSGRGVANIKIVALDELAGNLAQISVHSDWWVRMFQASSHSLKSSRQKRQNRQKSTTITNCYADGLMVPKHEQIRLNPRQNTIKYRNIRLFQIFSHYAY
jgi:hypothetical protein